MNQQQDPRQVQSDDALFAALQASKKKKKRRIIITVDMATVKSAMAQLQNEIKDLDDQINQAAAEPGVRQVKMPLGSQKVPLKQELYKNFTEKTANKA